MSRRIGLCLLLSAVVALNLAAPGLGRAEEPPVIQATEVEPILQDLILQVESETPDPSVCPDNERESAILEELKQTLGTHKVCGARCTSTTRCSQVCGDAATCRQGFCIYL